VRQVKRAYKERNGEISVIKRDKLPQMVNIAVDDGIKTVRIEFL
jgi:uncharacterized membrane protein YcaP (DUF421 family)